MATVGMQNLNDTPTQPGQLTAEDLTRFRNLHRVAMPLGCDQQGRYPEAAHAASEYDDEPRNARPLPWYMAELLGVPHQIVTAVALGIVTLLLVLGAWHVAMRLAA